MKNIYIVLTSTGTTLSKIIRLYTKDEFAHSSISLDKELQEMYSFGRLYAYNPFTGGFIHEYIDKGTFKRFYKTTSEIYRIEVEDNKYDKLKEKIDEFKQNKEKYKFNVLGLFAIAIDKKVKKKNSFYCAEFVKYVLEEAGIDFKLPELVRPESFKNIENKETIYKGLLKEYKANSEVKTY